MVFEEELATMKGHFGPINALAMFPNGRGYVTAGEDGILFLFFFVAGI